MLTERGVRAGAGALVCSERARGGEGKTAHASMEQQTLCTLCTQSQECVLVCFFSGTASLPSALAMSGPDCQALRVQIERLEEFLS